MNLIELALVSGDFEDRYIVRQAENSSTCRSRVTRQMVAAAAGVSVTTVTHALNPPPGARVRNSTRERVERVAAELGYRPSFTGRALVSGRTFSIGLLQPEPHSILYPFYQHIVFGMASAMAADDYHLLVLFRSDVAGYLKVIEQGRVDGLFILQSDREMGDIERIRDSGCPAVVVNRQIAPDYSPRIACVYSDHTGMMASAVADFATRGCRRILAIHDYRICDANAWMLDSFSEETAALAGQGIIGTTMLPAADAHAQFRSVFSGTPGWDGIFVDGLGTAALVERVAALSGRMPGRDFMLASCDTAGPGPGNAFPGEIVYVQQAEQIGRQAWAQMRALLAGEAGERMCRIPYQKLTRQSGK